MSPPGQGTHRFLYQTLMRGAIPCFRSTLNHARRHTLPLAEIGYTERRMKYAVEFYKRIGYHLPFFLISSDATALRPELVWCWRNCRISSSALPSPTYELLPTVDLRVEQKPLSAVRALLEKHGMGTQVYVVSCS
jgi:hypothetical protein